MNFSMLYKCIVLIFAKMFCYKLYKKIYKKMYINFWISEVVVQIYGFNFC